MKAIIFSFCQSFLNRSRVIGIDGTLNTKDTGSGKSGVFLNLSDLVRAPVAQR